MFCLVMAKSKKINMQASQTALASLGSSINKDYFKN